MADRTTRMELVRWPVGTVVSAYQRKSDLRLSDGPPPMVPVVATATVEADQSLTFTLPAGDYWAVAPLTAGQRDYFYLGFVLRDPPPVPPSVSEAILTRPGDPDPDPALYPDGTLWVKES